MHIANCIIAEKFCGFPNVTFSDTADEMQCQFHTGRLLGGCPSLDFSGKSAPL
jgi:hypothetical protein